MVPGNPPLDRSKSTLQQRRQYRRIEASALLDGFVTTTRSRMLRGEMPLASKCSVGYRSAVRRGMLWDAGGARLVHHDAPRSAAGATLHHQHSPLLLLLLLLWVYFCCCAAWPGRLRTLHPRSGGKMQCSCCSRRTKDATVLRL